MVGGITALLGAFFLGPRIGKYKKDGTPVAMPGHNLTIAALGVFILWFGWFGFNGGSSLGVSTFELGTLTSEVLLITCLAAACGTIGAMVTTWVRYGHPDVSFTLNGCLAGLVAICAGCAAVDYYGAVIIGLIAGVVVVFGAEFVEKKLKIDDPVGAFAVHGLSSIVGILSVGFLANPDCFSGVAGLLYGGGLDLLGIQVLGMLAIGAWTVICMGTVFFVLKHTVGLRVSEEEELSGLDLTEHGLANAYSGMVPDLHIVHEESELGLPVQPMGPSESPGIQVTDYSEPEGSGLKKVVIITGRNKLGILKERMDAIGVTGMTITYVEGYGAQKGQTTICRGVEMESTLLPKIKVEIVVGDIPLDKVMNTTKQAIYTGSVGDGKIFIYNVAGAVRVRTGEVGKAAVSNEV